MKSKTIEISNKLPISPEPEVLSTNWQILWKKETGSFSGSHKVKGCNLRWDQISISRFSSEDNCSELFLPLALGIFWLFTERGIALHGLGILANQTVLSDSPIFWKLPKSANASYNSSSNMDWATTRSHKKPFQKISEEASTILVVNLFFEFLGSFFHWIFCRGHLINSARNLQLISLLGKVSGSLSWIKRTSYRGRWTTLHNWKRALFHLS